jgi:hypothetical protein
MVDMGMANKTGGGSGTNQYKIRGQAKAASNTKRQTKTVCGYPVGRVVELGDCVWLRGGFDDVWCLKHRQLAPELRQLMGLAPCPWRNAGFEDPVEAAQWQGAGFDPKGAKGWHDAGLDPGEARRWDSAGFDPETAKEWNSVGVWNPREAQEWEDMGFWPAAAEGYVWAGFGPKEAKREMEL